MRTSLRSPAILLLLGGLLAPLAQAEDRPADKILADIKAVEMPKVPEDRTDRAAIQDYLLKRQKAMEQKSTLIGELYKAHPNAPELVELMPERWAVGMRPGGNPDEIAAEFDAILATSKNERLVTEAAYMKTVFAIRKAQSDGNVDPDNLMPAVDDFIKRAPKDPRGAMLLGFILSRTSDEARKEALNKRLEKDYPNSPAARQQASVKRQKEAIGKPFKLEFTEATTGTPITMASLKGKVVVVDFWATWCGPCIAEMPNMKKLYAEYKDKGVEFIGVSLDQPKENGGLDKLKAYVAKNEIGWPQYYQGNYWKSEFSSSWGINSIPRVFLVDADGNLASVEARGKLEELIPEFLEKAAKSQKDEAKP